MNTSGETPTNIDDEIFCFITESTPLYDPSFEAEHELEDENNLNLDVLIAHYTNTDPSEQLERISLEGLLRVQHAESFWASIRSRLNGRERLPFCVDEQWVLIRTVEVADEIVISHVLKSRVLHLAHYFQLFGRSGRTKLNLTLRRDFYRPKMAVDCHASAKLCTSCAKNRIKLWKRKRPVEILPAEAPLKYVDIDIVGELSRTKRGHTYLLVVTGRFSKLTRTVPLKQISAAVIAQAFMQECFYVNCSPLNLLWDDGKQFVPKFFQAVCHILGARNVFTMTYQPQTNGQVERSNRTILAALWH